MFYIHYTFLEFSVVCDDKTRIKVAFLLGYTHKALLIQSLVPHGQRKATCAVYRPI